MTQPTEPGASMKLKSMPFRSLEEMKSDIVLALCKEVNKCKDLDYSSQVLLEELLELCQGDKATLAQLLQTPFLNGQTPIKWILSALPAVFTSVQTFTPTQSFVSKLVAACEPRRGDIVETDFQEVCSKRNANAMYQIINKKAVFATCSSSYTVTTKSGWLGLTAYFTIPNFLERLLIEREVDVRFVGKGITWSISFAPKTNGDWEATSRTIHVEPTVRDKFKAGDILIFLYRCKGTIEDVGKITQKNLTDAYSQTLSISTGSDFVSSEGTLKGYFWL